MSLTFEFATAGRIVFGPGSSKQLADAARSMGTRTLVVCSRDWPLFDGLDHETFRVRGEPTIATVEEGVRVFHAAGCDVLIAVGGGSVLDAGKAIASMAANPGEVLDYIEVVGRGRAIEQPSYPMIAVPTTAGTGTEVTRNAVLGSPKDGVKASLRSPLMLPRLALIDPELTVGLPRTVTASTGLDALTQVIEPYVSAKRNDFVDLYCREGIQRIGRSLLRAYHQGKDLDARTDMCLASLLGGLSLANTGLGIVHGFAAPIGGMFQAPHGAVCAAMLPHGMAANIAALRERHPGSPVLQRYSDIAVWLTGRMDAIAEDGVDYVRGLCRELEIPSLRAYGIDESYVPVLVDKALKASSTKGNPVVLTASEMTDMLGLALKGFL